ncbi:MAG TPA: SSI family serine proteinase inhibitor [Gaiellaceae bacterium]|nr:SSI family serine proteinase inhibitor [Gaiellaceae bacterium]
MRIALLAALALAASTLPAASATTVAPATTSLTISFWDEGREQGAPKRWTLRCGPVGGTHPKRAEACRKLATLKAPFAPLGDDLVCTQIYGGPQQAIVTGKYRGSRVWTQLTLRDGCQIARFKQLAFLVPGFSVTSGGTATR